MQKKLVEEIKKNIRKSDAGCDIHFFEVIGSDGSLLPTIAVKKTSEGICPAIRIDHLLDTIKCGLARPEDAAREFMDMYNKINDISQYTRCFPNIDLSYFKRNVAYRLVNAEKNTLQLSQIPHREMLDLTITYSVHVDLGHTRDEYIIVDNALCEKLSISHDELEEYAELNTEFHGFRVQPDPSCQPVGTGAETNPAGLWVVTTKTGTNGSTALVYPYYIKRLSGKLKKDLYIVASSKDRIIAAPVEKWTDLSSLRAAADKINAAHGPQNFLTDTIYRFRRRNGMLEIAQQFEK